ncbi:MAG: hypothetical protein E7622_02695 [Ruminococcaceae bacterium]|nr:hypothetical protein [Oscillospiraceae bacterium]
MKKKILLFVLAFAMIFTSLVSVAHADEPAGEGATVDCDCPVHNPDAKVPSLECSNEERVVNIASEATFTVQGGTWHIQNHTSELVDGDWHIGMLGNNTGGDTYITATFADPNYVTDINIVVNSYGINLPTRPWDTIPVNDMTEKTSDGFGLYITLYTWDEVAQEEKVMDLFNNTKLTWTGDQQVVTINPNARVTKIVFKNTDRWAIMNMIWEVEVFSTEISHIWELDNTDTAPTCTVDGVGDYKCMCGAENNDQPIPALGHEAGEEYFVLPAVPAVEDDPATLEDETAAAVPSKHYNLCTREDCNEKLNISDHEWSHACDVKCDKCGETRTSDEAHAYEKADCQTKCDNCDFVRTDATVQHTYEHDCDTSCEECDEIRTTAGHQYTDCEDTECNVVGCGETRTAPGHAYDNACDNTCNNGCSVANPDYIEGHLYDNCDDTVCNECEFERTALAHIYDNCDDTQCNTCGMTRTAVAHVYDNACDGTCNNCTVTRTPADHVYDNACDATCNVCNAERTPADHVYDNACDATCNVCNAARTPADHVYDNACDTTCNVCNAERTVADHAWGEWAENEEGYEERACANCGVKETGDKAGLGGGAIAGIVIGSVAVVGGGGFAAWWFIFKKKAI